MVRAGALAVPGGFAAAGCSQCFSRAPTPSRGLAGEQVPTSRKLGAGTLLPQPGTPIPSRRGGGRAEFAVVAAFQALCAFSRSRISASSVSSLEGAGGADGAACFAFITKPRNLTMKRYSAKATMTKLTSSPRNRP